MRSTLLALTLATLSIFWGPPTSAIAQDGASSRTMTSNGTVKAVGGDWITITGNSGSGATFEQTFKVASSTQVLAKGASTAVAAKGGTVPFRDLVVSGDHVSVSYHKSANGLLASDVRVTIKAPH